MRGQAAATLGRSSGKVVTYENQALKRDRGTEMPGSLSPISMAIRVVRQRPRLE